MVVSLRCQYALRALFELSARTGEGPVKISDIAQAQAIPPRFLEVILGELKQGGFVASQRGSNGGYHLRRLPENLKVSEVIRFVQGPVEPVECTSGGSAKKCRLYGDCVFLPMWEKVRESIWGVFDSTTFGDLLEQKARKAQGHVPSYSI